MIEKTQINPILEGQALINYNARKFLANTDWKVIRHLDQLAAGETISLSEAEYQELSQQRQAVRDSVVEQ